MVIRSRTDVKKCGTCQYWTGNRIPVFTEKGEPRVDIIDDVGECECGTCNFYGYARKQTLSCKKYSKWTELF